MKISQYSEGQPKTIFALYPNGIVGSLYVYAMNRLKSDVLPIYRYCTEPS